MSLWIVFAVMTAAAALTVLWPLSRRGVAARDPAASDRAVYRDQLDEIERDMARGLVGPLEAQAARAEVARRLIATAGATVENSDTAKATSRRRMAAVAGAVALPGLALGLYIAIGSPDLPAQPLAQRLTSPEAEQNIALLVRRIEGHLAGNPDDARGWSILAPVYARLGRPRDAIHALNQATRLLGPSAERHIGIGEALLALSGGVVTGEAKSAFHAAVDLEPGNVRARFHLARAAVQDGDAMGARAAFERIVADSPQDAPWLPLVRQEIAALGGPQISTTDAREEATAAAIRDMVDRLAARLRDSGDDPEGWQRLVRSYAILGEAGKARDAAAAARRALAHRPDAVAGIDSLVRELGLGG